MSAPSIPNLLSLRGGATGRGRGRGRGPSAGPGSASAPTSSGRHDATIQGTDNDAAVSRTSAVELGYLSDPFAAAFSDSRGQRRLPIINRGTYTRTTAIDILVNHFLSSTDSSKPRQIVSLGAGTDTRSCRVFTSPENHSNISYHEIDFPTIISRKKQTILSHPLPSRVLSPTQSDDTSESISTTFHHRSVPGNTLTLHALDLRDLTPSHSPLLSLSPSYPTLLLSECCLCYLPLPSNHSLLSFFSSFSSLGLVIYEPILPNDAFGKMMVSNLAARGITMPTLSAYPTPTDQEKRLHEIPGGGLKEARSKTIDQIWEGWVSDDEKERVNSLEGGLDEVEEWRLLAGHYIVAWGWRGEGWDLDVDGGRLKPPSGPGTPTR
ncbi:S-adenosyl-L-methionine-dependent methyltransferase [Podospora australis]|uniref:Leucine carboxyl methyltransferase 1 n=1 Tax=Podospora australis TaxID=1536484 RepID=A0AAN6WUU7_9PEZI|nr:S-adenosyl-L-methionine-dependent methyltransferase [Podospora australis]